MGFRELRRKMKWVDPFTYVEKYVIERLEPLSQNAKHVVFAACLAFLSIASLTIVPSASGSLPLLAVIVAGLSIFYFHDRKEGLDWAVYISFAFAFAWLLFTGTGLLLGTSSPMVIVLSGSMEPLYHRGDVIILQGASPENLAGPEAAVQRESLAQLPFSSFADPAYSDQAEGIIEGISLKDSGQVIGITRQGSIVVYWSELRQQPIIHRVVAKLHALDGWYILTKGDSVHNPTIDQDCGAVDAMHIPEKPCIQLFPVRVEELQGKAILQVPFVGCFKLWLLDDLASLVSTGKLPADFAGLC
ncbi:MAG: hypothetical protein JW744_03210 [Candidatus Diapherotrites archaeon]|uniref:Signal peptidase I n=1 Tax=Candidatus Iainarchaeum sp. TaxID=3101447 RepID=A0A938YRA4_9ARCH|nr:hypothetical protein [Candidatus Diapherotrites archaeon]